jgi:hypothetical protein
MSTSLSDVDMVSIRLLSAGPSVHSADEATTAKVDGRIGVASDASVPNERPAPDVGCCRNPATGSTMVRTPPLGARGSAELPLRDTQTIDVRNPLYDGVIRCFELGSKRSSK